MLTDALREGFAVKFAREPEYEERGVEKEKVCR